MVLGVLMLLFSIVIWTPLLTISHNMIFRERHQRLTMREGLNTALALVGVQFAVSVVLVILTWAIPSLSEFPLFTGILFYSVLLVAGVMVIRRMMGGLEWKHAIAIMVIACVLRWLVGIGFAAMMS